MKNKTSWKSTRNKKERHKNYENVELLKNFIRLYHKVKRKGPENTLGINTKMKILNEVLCVSL